jgi:quercetin dioxygenase-like cupin family protein
MTTFATEAPEATKAAPDGFNLAALTALTIGERVIDPDLIPWVPYVEGVDVKPLRLNRKTGVWVNLTRVVGGGTVSRHYHGSSVVGYVLEGGWHYIERNWKATAGMMIWEPPGDIHTLVTSPEGTTTLFLMEGPLFYLNDDDHVIGFDDVLSFTKMYRDYCASQGIEALDLDY